MEIIKNHITAIHHQIDKCLRPTSWIQIGLFFFLAVFVLHPSLVLGQTSMQGSVTSHGITWTFSESAEVGQFVNGDYYVVGAVTVSSITPTPGNGRNGSVLNVPANQNRSGFDDRTVEGRYDQSLTATLPINMVPGDALVSSISVETFGELRAAFYESDQTRSPVQSVSILTCLEEAVSADAFRPGYCDREQKIYYADDLRRELLPKLAKVPSTPELSLFEFHYERPWLECVYFGFDACAEYQTQYGREAGRANGMASLMLMLDFTDQEKEKLLISFVQYGIDLWGIIGAGHPGWHAHGGHGHGRKWPIVFAGILLNDTQMASPTVTYPNVNFSEDMQTMYDDGWTGANVVYAGHMGVNGEQTREGWGPYEHLHPSEWASRTGEAYRRCCTSIAWVGQGLAGRLIKAEPYWAHNAFFDYVDRWMTEDDTEHVAEILSATGENFGASWQSQGQAWDTFVNEMWATYRNTISSTPDIKNFAPPDEYRLNQNYPNPFNPSTKIRFSLMDEEIVNIDVYNAIGQKIETLINKSMAAGHHEIEFSKENLPGGIYFYRIKAGKFQDVRKMVLLK